eukprot:5993257-Amphidinium_carterae.1
MARQESYKPPHRLTGVAQLNDIAVKKEITLENNEDKEEKKLNGDNYVIIMKDIQLQPWPQYEEDITKYNEKAIEDAMNKELSQLVSKQSFKESRRGL